MNMAALKNVYEIHRSEDPLPLVFDSPHSGRLAPDDFRPSCDPALLAVDHSVDELFSSAPAHRATLLCALFPRTYIDVNRAVTDIDPALHRDRWPGPTHPTPRSHAGIGLIHRLAKPGLPVYDRTLTVPEIRHRIEHYYKPYHTALKGLLEDLHYRFGAAWHINCHSMPATSCDYDFVIGDHNGLTSSPAFLHMLRDTLSGMGYKVAINHVYKGGEIIRRHAAPAKGIHSLQIEINRALYWDEKSKEKSINFNQLKEKIDKLVLLCGTYVRHNLINDMAAD